jgi:chromosome segregation ATPase
MGIGSAVVAVKTFILAHKLAVGISTGVAAAGGVAYWKRKAIGDLLFKARYSQLMTELDVANGTADRLGKDLVELQAKNKVLEETMAKWPDATVLQRELAQSKSDLAALLRTHDEALAAKSRAEKELMMARERIETLTAELLDGKTQLTGLADLSRNQAEEIQRLMNAMGAKSGRKDGRIAELDATNRKSNAAIPSKKRRQRAEQARANAAMAQSQAEAEAASSSGDGASA